MDKITKLGKRSQDELRQLMYSYKNGYIDDAKLKKALAEKIQGKTREEWHELYMSRKADDSAATKGILRNYIKENLAKGYSLSQIEKALSLYGYDGSLVNSLIQENRKIKPIAVVFTLLVLVLFSTFLLRPAIVGYVTLTREATYTDTLNIVRNESTEYMWIVQNPGKILSIQLSGAVEQGPVKIYLEQDPENLLVLDSSSLDYGSVPAEPSGPAEIPYENSTLDIALDYASGTSYDEDDDGIAALDEIVDFTVEHSPINLNSSFLCTSWQVESSSGTTALCYGSQDCCSILNLVPEQDSWDDSFYLNYGSYGASYDNNITAQLIYADYSLDLDDPYADIRYSDIRQLGAVFYTEESVFEDECAETCNIEINQSVFKLIIQTNGTSISLGSITYDVVETSHRTLQHLTQLASEARQKDT